MASVDRVACSEIWIEYTGQLFEIRTNLPNSTELSPADENWHLAATLDQD